jgi:hypothetical protein
LPGSGDYGLVALPVFLAMLTSYAAPGLAGRVAARMQMRFRIQRTRKHPGVMLVRTLATLASGAFLNKQLTEDSIHVSPIGFGECEVSAFRSMSVSERRARRWQGRRDCAAFFRFPVRTIRPPTL